MNRLAYIKRYISYLLRAKTKYYLHSPFAYHLMSEVIQDNRHFYAFDEIEKLRMNLLQSKQKIQVQDYGAGSKKMNNKRSVRQIVNYAAISPKKGKLLFNLVNHYEAQHILELGSSLGLATAYMAKVHPKNKITTIEGCTETAQIAQQNFNELGLKNIQLLPHTFEKAIPQLIQQAQPFDLIYFDGNHQKAATLNYFRQLLFLKKNTSIFVLDDINWSKGMNEAWQTIINHPEVTISIDLFQTGIVFFKKDQAKQHFRLYF